MFGPLPDHEITALAYRDTRPMITPFEPESVKEVTLSAKGEFGSPNLETLRKVISYGTSSYGYDARLAETFKVFSDTYCAVMDPKDPDPRAFVDRTEKERLIIPPRGYVLGHTIETFDIPDDVVVVCLGKSTYARTGLIVNVTPLEPGWRGQVTLEFFNALPIPTIVYPGEGICQFIFLRGAPCERPYGVRSGKYNDQRGVVLSR